jgi:hypothetical protein
MKPISQILNDAKGVIMLDLPVMRKVASDKDTLKPAIALVFLSSLITSLWPFFIPQSVGPVLYRPDIFSALQNGFFLFLFEMALIVALAYAAEHLFGSKLKAEGYIRVMGYASVISIAIFIPFISVLVGIWGLVIMVKVHAELGRLEWTAILLLVLLNMVLAAGLPWVFDFLQVNYYSNLSLF